MSESNNFSCEYSVYEEKMTEIQASYDWQKPIVAWNVVEIMEDNYSCNN